MSADRPRRRNTNRAVGYDYTTPGSYYVTVCTHRLQPMLGEIVDGEMRLNEAGRITEAVWNDLPARFPHIDLDASVIMPNHVHGIIVLYEGPEDRENVRAQFIAPSPQPGQTPDSCPDIAVSGQGAINRARTEPVALGEIIRVFKAVTTDRVRRSGLTDFRWHRNFYDHIIRDERDMDRVRAYVMDNPTNWQYDRANRKETLAL